MATGQIYRVPMACTCPNSPPRRNTYILDIVKCVRSVLHHGVLHVRNRFSGKCKGKDEGVVHPIKRQTKEEKNRKCGLLCCWDWDFWQL